MQMLWELESSLYTHLLFEIKPTQRREDELREVCVGGKVKEDVRSGGSVVVYMSWDFPQHTTQVNSTFSNFFF